METPLKSLGPVELTDEQNALYCTDANSHCISSTGSAPVGLTMFNLIDCLREARRDGDFDDFQHYLTQINERWAKEQNSKAHSIRK